MFKKIRNNIGAVILITILGLVLLGATYVNLGPTSLIDGDIGVTAGHGYYIDDTLLSITDITVPDESIPEAKLDIDNSPADEYVLTWESDSGKMHWQEETGGGASTFVALTDTPANYTGQAGKYTKVNVGETALEFGTPAGVDTSGTPEANDIARFTDVDTIEGINYTELKTALALSSDDLSDVSSIAMLDENEIVSGNWSFADWIDLNHSSDTPASSPYIDFRKKRDGDPTYNVSSGDRVGMIDFSGYSTDYCEAARIQVIIDGTPGLNDMPGRLEFFTTPDGSATPALRQTIDNAGNIKMGDGAWTNYVNISNLGVLTLEGTANIEGVDANELSYLDGVNSDIQTQLNAKLETEVDPTVDEDSELKAILVDEVTKTGDFTVGRITKINNATGIIEQGTNTDTDVADAITKKHTQNTDTILVFTNALASDHTYSGEIDSQPVGESVVFGDLLYPDWTAEEWLKADADLAAKMPGLRIALESKADGQACLMLVKGYLRDDSAFDFAGSMIYTSVTPGAMSSTAPTETGDQVQRVGVAKSADILFFDPSIDVGEI